VPPDPRRAEDTAGQRYCVVSRRGPRALRRARSLALGSSASGGGPVCVLSCHVGCCRCPRVGNGASSATTASGETFQMERSGPARSGSALGPKESGIHEEVRACRHGHERTLEMTSEWSVTKNASYARSANGITSSSVVTPADIHWDFVTPVVVVGSLAVAERVRQRNGMQS